MKSKTSCFSGALFKKNLKMNIACSLVFFMGLLYYGSIMFINWSDHVKSAKSAQEILMAKNDALVQSVSLSGQVGLTAIIAVVIGVLSFFYLYDRRANQMIHAMPFTRTQLFITNYLGGLLALVVPIILNGILMQYAVSAKELAGVIASIYLYLIAAAVLFFSFTVFLCMICGVIYLPPVFFVIFNYLHLVFRRVINYMMSNLIYGYKAAEISIHVGGEKEYMLSPLYYLLNGNTIGYAEDGVHAQFQGGYAFVWYFLVAAVFVVLACITYRNRPLESHGDYLTKKWIKVFFSIGITTCISILVMYVITDYEKKKAVEHSFGMINPLLVLVICLLAYMLTSAVIRRSIHIRKKIVFIPAGILTFVLVVGMGMIQYDVLGIENKIPDEGDVASYTITSFIEGKQDLPAISLEDTLNIHERLIAEKDYMTRTSADVFLPIEITYQLKNGKTLARSYQVPYVASCLENEDSILSFIDRNYNDFVGVFQDIYSQKFRCASFTMRTETEDYATTELDEEFLGAFRKDVEAGALKVDYPEFAWGIDHSGAEITMYEAYVTMEFNESKDVEIWSSISPYNTSVWSYVSDDGQKVAQLQFYFNSDCTNLMEYLEAHGVDLSQLQDAEDSPDKYYVE